MHLQQFLSLRNVEVYIQKFWAGQSCEFSCALGGVKIAIFIAAVRGTPSFLFLVSLLLFYVNTLLILFFELKKDFNLTVLYAKYVT